MRPGDGGREIEDAQAGECLVHFRPRPRDAVSASTFANHSRREGDAASAVSHPLRAPPDDAMRARRGRGKVGSRQREPVAFEAGVAQGLDTRQRRVGGDGDAMDDSPVAHHVAAGIAEVGVEGAGLGAVVALVEGRPPRTRQRSAHVAVRRIDEEPFRVLAQRALGRAAVLVDDLPTLEPPRARQCRRQRCHDSPCCMRAWDVAKSRAPARRSRPRRGRSRRGCPPG